MKSNIISLVIVNIICFAFIFATVFITFGTKIDVVRNVEALPVEIGSTQSRHMRKGMTYYSTNRMVKVKTDDSRFESIWIDGDRVFGTNDRDKLQEIVDKHEHIKINVFINPDTGEALGVTLKGDSKLALFYTNNKLLRYGSIIIPAVDVFVILTCLISGRSKKKKQKKAANADA